MKKILLISILGALATMANAQVDVKTSAESVNIISNGKTSDDMIISGEGPYTAGGGSGNPNPNWYLKGYEISNGSSLENANTIDLNGKYNAGISLRNDSDALNSGIINLNGTNGVAILLEDGTGSIMNTSSGIINFTDGYGIASKGYAETSFTGFIQNDGLIISNNGGLGISVYGGQTKAGGLVINNGTIRVENSPVGATAARITGFTLFINNGELYGSNPSLYSSGGILGGSAGAQLYNSESGVITGKNYANGVYVSNSSLTNVTSIVNDGIINVDKGYGIYAVASNVENNGTISSNGTGIYATKFSNGTPISTVVNNGTIIIGNNGTGIRINQSIGENNGELVISGNNSTGFHIIGGRGYAGQITNNHDITSDSDKTGVTLVKVDGSTTVGDETAHIYNNASLTALGDNSTVIYSLSNGKIHNAGNITVNNGIGIKLEYSSLNAGDNTGLVTVKGNGIGILAGASNYSGSILENDGKIVLENNGTGIYVLSGNTYLNGTTGNNTGGIVFLGEGGTGIYVTDAKSSFANHSDLEAAGDNTTGIYITKSATVTNTGNMTLSGDNSIGIDISEGGILGSNTGIINVNNGIGINLRNVELKEEQNTGTIYVNGENGVGINGQNSIIVNGTGIEVNNGTGIKSVQTEVTNGLAGRINVLNGTAIDTDSSVVLNQGVLSNGNGTGIKSVNSYIQNAGEINVVNGTGISATDGSFIVNDSLLKSGDTGIHSEGSVVFNDGIIDAGGTGLYAYNNINIMNTGEISGKTGVEINSGAEEFSGHFFNTGKISGTEYAIKFDNGNSVLELGNGSIINGKIDASGGENILVVNGNIKLDSADNFSKLVAIGDSTVSGTINLKPAEDYSYYTGAYTESKNTDNIANEENLGELTLSGVINVGVNYDGITDETAKTGKILTSGLKLQNGSVVLNNAGNTVNDIATESGKTNYGDQIRIKSIIVSNKQQAVDPEFRFQTAGGMNEAAGWTRETTARIENGVTVLDEVYTNNNKVNSSDTNTDINFQKTTDLNSNSEEKTETNEETNVSSELVRTAEKDTEIKPISVSSVKINAVPRNRVDLDNVNKMNTLSERFLNMEADRMAAGETKQTIEYTGAKKGSYFSENNNFNYDYNVDSNGIAGTTLHKYTDNFYGGISLGYTDSEVKYSNDDNEKINSFNTDIFGRYEIGNWNLGGHFGYGYNRHELEVDWLMSGKKVSNYESHVINTGITAGYDMELGNTGLILSPAVGMDYVIVNEGTIKTDGMSDIESAAGKGAVGKIGLSLGNSGKNFRWKAGIGYEQNFTDTFHKERKMVNGYTMEKLYYGKDTLRANLDMDYKLSDKFSIKSGYEYENNSNYENHKFDVGISYTLGVK
ncbi:hypothetical protein [Sebaldella sp. S0638]|uniref:hypothetical protein n=1 Tax=Sebaldella sp. S0638 TaxID=2957809 RepID=UPI00209CEDC8|nr:hypothetical protein [Sebaldella sp. S0638]MCP1225820.1 hypothetical protein [Sebaldella sp. S0638]